MPRPYLPKVITANALLKGDVVYMTAKGMWSRCLSDAEILEDEADAQIRLLDASAQSSEVVGVYLSDVKRGPNGAEPIHFRENFRRTGPSNYRHGKQEGQANV